MAIVLEIFSCRACFLPTLQNKFNPKVPELKVTGVSLPNKRIYSYLCLSHWLLRKGLLALYNFQRQEITFCCCSAAKSCPTHCEPMDCCTPGSPVLHHLPELAQIPVHWVGDAIQPSHPLPPILPQKGTPFSQYRRIFFNEMKLHGLSPHTQC